jgi:ketosteroid isomerase-like protein
LLIEGEKACALNRYELRSSKGGTFSSDAAEIFAVRNGKIVSFAIYFDSSPFAK